MAAGNFGYHCILKIRVASRTTNSGFIDRLSIICLVLFFNKNQTIPGSWLEAKVNNRNTFDGQGEFQRRRMRPNSVSVNRNILFHRGSVLEHAKTTVRLAATSNDTPFVSYLSSVFIFTL